MISGKLAAGYTVAAVPKSRIQSALNVSSWQMARGVGGICSPNITPSLFMIFLHSGHLGGISDIKKASR
jgi:hypothetical protein